MNTAVFSPWQCIQASLASPCSVTTRHNPNKLTSSSSFAPQQYSSKLDIALGLASVWLLRSLLQSLIRCSSGLTKTLSFEERGGCNRLLSIEKHLTVLYIFLCLLRRVMRLRRKQGRRQEPFHLLTFAFAVQIYGKSCSNERNLCRKTRRTP